MLGSNQNWRCHLLNALSRNGPEPSLSGKVRFAVTRTGGLVFTVFGSDSKVKLTPIPLVS
jgi:hypothetical protein